VHGAQVSLSLPVGHYNNPVEINKAFETKQNNTWKDRDITTVLIVLVLSIPVITEILLVFKLRKMLLLGAPANETVLISA
jgi:hypothetical protein